MTEREILLAEAKAMSGIPLGREEIVRLLSLPTGSEEDRILREAALRVARHKTGNRAYVWGAIGADFAPCEMNCKFCSFGAQWGLVHREQVLTPEEMVARADCRG